ncbi:hypothetical protein F5B18DRAFT_376944 [Nemania serpens]|nr:hypothetical protein F5B18DRAFT_376944 [Nemania serpens]
MSTPTTQAGMRRPSRIGAVMRENDRAWLSTLAPSKNASQHTSWSKIADDPVPYRSKPSSKNTDVSRRSPLDVPSTRAPSGSLDGFRLSKARAEPYTSQYSSHVPAPAPVPPSTFPPAVKASLYSSWPRPCWPRSSTDAGYAGSKKPDIPRRDGGLAGDNATGRRRDLAAIAASALILGSNPGPEPVPISQQPTYTFKRATSEAAVVVEAQPRTPQPRTPQPRPRSNARPPAYYTPSSASTSGDPYLISSGSDSDSDSDTYPNADNDINGHGKGNGGSNRASRNPPALKSFAKFDFADAHEPASDVEAVLEEFPAWLRSSPCPTVPRKAVSARAAAPPTLHPTLQSSTTTTVRPTTTTTTTVRSTTATRQSTAAKSPSEKSGGQLSWTGTMRGKARGDDGYPVRFGGEEGSPVPVPVPGLTRRLPSASRIERISNSPAGRIAVPAQSGAVRAIRIASSSFPSTSSSLSSSSAASPPPSFLPLPLPLNERTATLESESDLDLGSGEDEDERVDLFFNREHEHKREQNHPVKYEEDISPRPRKKTRRRHSGQDKAASRHRNRDREAWRRRQWQQQQHKGRMPA